MAKVKVDHARANTDIRMNLINLLYCVGINQEKMEELLETNTFINAMTCTINNVKRNVLENSKVVTTITEKIELS